MGRISALTELTNVANNDYIVVLDTSANIGKKTSVANFSNAILPAGIVSPFGGATEPTGWLFCYGQTISRTTYSALFTAIGTTYGVGDGSTTFVLPDLRGRAVAGKDNMGGSSANRLTAPATVGSIDGDVLGNAGGQESHIQTLTELAAHSHTTQNYSQFVAGGFWAAGSSYNLGTTSGTNSAGSSSPANVVQPTIILNYIIKT